MNGLDLDELAALLAVSQAGSFVAASRKLQRHSTVLSKRIASLESRLGVRLIERSTRRLHLTQVGQSLADRVGAVIGMLVEAQEEAASGAALARGTLRLALPAAMGRMWIARLLPEFLVRYPSVSLDITYSENFIDLIDQGVDCAIRIGTLKDSRLIAQKLGDHQRILTASPAYLERAAALERPSDLRSHDCLEYTGFSSFPEWRMSDGRGMVSVTARGTLKCDDTMALLWAARAGVGIMAGGEWLFQDDLATGALVRVLPAWSLDADGGIYLVRPSKRHPPAHVRAFVEWIEGKFRPHPPWIRSEPS